MVETRPLPRHVSATAIAALLGVEVATLERWHLHRHGPPVAARRDNGLIYSRVGFESWCDHLGASAARN